MRVFYITILMLAAAIQAVGQFEQRTQSPVMSISLAKEEIKIDGDLNDAAWKEAAASSDFLNKWPLDSGLAEARTSVKITFDENYLYIGAIMYQKREDLVIMTLKRDQQNLFWNSENFALVLDPINQKTNGFIFGLNAAGAQFDGTINLQGQWSVSNENWDNKWFSSVKVHDDFWVAEMAIPFTVLRFKNLRDDWGINLIRTDMKRNVYSTWSHVPVQFNGIDLGHLGLLRWADRIEPNRSRITLIPFVSGAVTRNHADSEPVQSSGDAGLDAKVSLTSSLNLDLTYRPDFSNVDVDQQMTNVTRFSLFFPERRNFFLENADLFSGYGSWLVRPFFSRKIGLQDGQPVPIIAGARLSGNLTDKLRIGIMDIQTDATEELSANNFFVSSFQHRIWSRSSIKVMAANRQMTKVTEGDTQTDFNRTYGAEFQYISTNGKLNANFRAHTSQTPEKFNEASYYSAHAGYNSGKFYSGSMIEYTGENYVNDFGFVPRLHHHDAALDTVVRIGHYALNPWFGLLIRPKNSRFNLIEPNTWSVVTYRKNGEFLERNTSVNLSFFYKSTARLFFEAFSTSVNLPFPADLVDGDIPLPAKRYDFTQFTTRYSSDTRKSLSGDVSFTYGGFYNGTRLEYGGAVNVRVQPWGTFGISYLQNDIRLPGEYGSAQFILVGPRAEISLRNNMWWTNFLQYNTQAENFNINSRLQWRFKPMSDLFIVYTDNYTSTNLKVKNRGLVVKLTYWLNL